MASDSKSCDATPATPSTVISPEETTTAATTTTTIAKAASGTDPEGTIVPPPLTPPAQPLSEAPGNDANSPEPEEEEESLIEAEDASDSGYDTDNLSVSVISASSSVFQFVHEHGHRYHRKGEALLPNDDTEQDRLDLQHHIFRMLFDGGLTHTTLPTDKALKIVDVGCGTGIWAIEMGDMFENANIIGIDESPIQPSWVPPNVQFEIDDITKPWLMKQSSIDFVHIRTMAGCIPSWPTLLSSALDALKPGGLIEVADFMWDFECQDGSMAPDSMSVKWAKQFHELATETFKMDFGPSPKMGDWMAGAGFEDVKVTTMIVPVGPWPKDPKLKEIGRNWRATISRPAEEIDIPAKPKESKSQQLPNNSVAKEAENLSRRSDTRADIGALNESDSSERWYYSRRSSPASDSMPLFSRLRRGSSQADADPHSWNLLSSYSAPKPGGKQTVIPNPKIFANVFIPSEPQAGKVETILAYPQTSHTAVHLALLECFRNLRLSANALDVEVLQPPTYDQTPRPGSAQLPESQRWDLLIKLAVTRFAGWWSNIGSVMNHASVYSHHGSKEVAVQLAKDYLPPLDVLLVWYAFALDSEGYDDACRNHERDIPQLRKLCFPWPAIRDVIDMDKMQFSLPRAAQNLFSNLSGQSPDIIMYLESPPAYTVDRKLPFEANLFAEVKKHESFIDVSHELLWIRSPALQGTLVRASVEYLEFQLSGSAAGNEGSMSHLSFGLSLLWRTHRLYPLQYEAFIKEVVNSQPASDSKSPKKNANSSLKNPDPDLLAQQCRCWTCERIRDDLPTFTLAAPPYSSSPASSSSNPRQQQQLSLSSDQVREIKDDLSFYHAVEGARRCKAPLPTRPPTAAEKEAERIAKEKQKEIGYMPGLNEYFEILPDGTRKIRRQKTVGTWGKGAWV
ncbi:hypothetical protein V490_06314 [Pseudogymnoascus sp. VKM F-3557]|nr:hypothetical protein V490_06314 [Pseudogymnoascus sp. VKM F-3557]